MTVPEIIRLQEQLIQVANPVGFLASLFAYSPVGFAIFTADGNFVLSNKAFRDLFGSEPPAGYNILTDNVAITSGLHPYFQRAFSGEIVHIPTFWYDPRDLTTVSVTEGNRVAISMYVFPLQDENERWTYVAATYKDETQIMLVQEQLLAEGEREKALLNALEVSERRYRALTENSATLIMLVGADGRYVYVSPSVTQLFGFSAEEMVGQLVVDFVHPDEIENRDRPFTRLYSNPGVTLHDVERRMLHKDGSWRWVEGYATNLLEDPGVGALLFNYRDTTARKQAELLLQDKDEELRMTTQQLWQTARLATMGELAASIAHELNNPLAIALLRIENVLATQTPGTPDHRSLEIVDGELERMRRLVANLLEFGRRSQRQVSTLSVCDEIERTFEIVQYYMNTRHITTRLDCQPDIPFIAADRQQMRQLFLNLFTNAGDAMPSGGTLTVTVVAGGPDNQPGVSITLADTGVGISAEAMTRLWEPFYTTKPEGKGTGLGLPICRRIVHEHSGTIEVQSTLGHGTTIHIFLPS